MVKFSLTPGQAMEGIVNFGTKSGRNWYHDATKPLDEELYDCTPEGLYQFLEELKTRIDEAVQTVTRHYAQ